MRWQRLPDAWNAFAQLELIFTCLNDYQNYRLDHALIS